MSAVAPVNIVVKAGECCRSAPVCDPGWPCPIARSLHDLVRFQATRMARVIYRGRRASSPRRRLRVEPLFRLSRPLDAAVRIDRRPRKMCGRIFTLDLGHASCDGTKLSDEVPTVFPHHVAKLGAAQEVNGLVGSDDARRLRELISRTPSLTATAQQAPWFVGGVVLPAVPDDVEPGAGGDADGRGKCALRSIRSS